MAAMAAVLKILEIDFALFHLNWKPFWLESQDGRPSSHVENLFWTLFILKLKANWLETSLEVSGWLVDQKQQKSFWLAIQDGCRLENLYWTFESKGQLTRNLSRNQVNDTGPSWPSCFRLSFLYWCLLLYVSIQVWKWWYINKMCLN